MVDQFGDIRAISLHLHGNLLVELTVIPQLFGLVGLGINKQRLSILNDHFQPVTAITRKMDARQSIDRYRNDINIKAAFQPASLGFTLTHLK